MKKLGYASLVTLPFENSTTVWSTAWTPGTVTQKNADKVIVDGVLRVVRHPAAVLAFLHQGED